MERRWAFAAALSWFILAVIALIPAILGVVTIVALPYGVIIGLLGVIIPFFIGRGSSAGPKWQGSWALSTPSAF